MAPKPGLPTNAPGSLIKLELLFLSLAHLTQCSGVNLASVLASVLSSVPYLTSKWDFKVPEPGALQSWQDVRITGALNNNTIRVSEVRVKVIF